MNKNRYKDISKFRAAKHRQNKRYYNKYKPSENSGKRWTDDENKIVLAHRITDREISEIIRRPVRSIQVQRSRLKHLGITSK